MEGKIKLEPRSKRSKNQSWKVSRKQSEVRFDFAERKELRLKVKVSFEAGGWQASF